MRIENEIRIDAPVDRVWEVTRDVERWPEWTPTVTAVKLLTADPFGLGSVARIRQPLQPEAEWTVTDWQPGRRFAWATSRPGMRMVGIHEMSEAASGTVNRLAVEVEGWLAALVWPLLKPAIRKSLKMENAGLKRRCEQG